MADNTSGIDSTATVAERGIARIVTTPPPAPGFVGDGHTAVPVVDPNDFEHNDPFILLMDDRLDLPPGRSAGGAHPHAGFETVTFVVEGELRDRDEGLLRAGDVVWMTAGSGVIHNEDVVPLGRSRILQLWLTLPSSSRWAPPRFERIARDSAPLRRDPGVEARVYSGASGPARATTHNYVPVTMVDVRLDADAVFEQELPASYNGFVYVLDGEVVAGDSRQTRLKAGQVGWLESVDPATSTSLRLTGAAHGARVVLYAGERQGVPIVMHGPFVGETRADLMRVSQAYIQGRMPRVSELAGR
jgi:redox-sensitive bicupin YhaK (pirin superfamily)